MRWCCLIQPFLGKDEVSSSNLLSSSMVEPFRNLPKGLIFCLQTENFLTEKWGKKIIKKSKILVDRLPFFWYSNKAPGERGNRIKGYSSAGRAAVSKTACRGFESFCPCQKPVTAKAFTGFFVVFNRENLGDTPGWEMQKAIHAYIKLGKRCSKDKVRCLYNWFYCGIWYT